MSKPMFNIVVGTSRKKACVSSLRHPAYRRREFIIGIYAERENLLARWQEKTSSSGHYKAERIEAWSRGGMSRSSKEASVMGAERRGHVVRSSSMRKTEVYLQEVPK